MWDLNLGVHACQKFFKPFRHRNTHASIYLVYKRNFLIYINITVGFKKTDSDACYHCRFILKTGSDI